MTSISPFTWRRRPSPSRPSPRRNTSWERWTLSATASSGLTVAFASATPAVCTVSGALQPEGPGDCVIHATQAGNKTVYSVAPLVSQSFIVHLNPQTITFPAITGTLTRLQPCHSSATSSSGLAVTFASTTPTVSATQRQTQNAHRRHLHPAGHPGRQCGLRRRDNGPAECGGAPGLANHYLPGGRRAGCRRDCHTGSNGQFGTGRGLYVGDYRRSAQSAAPRPEWSALAHA